MTVDFSEIHDDLRSVARDLLGTETPLTGDGGASAPASWSTMAELGWLGLEVPESLGGAGATFAEVAVVLEEMGRAATVGPYFGTVVMGVGALGLLEATPARDELLALVAQGGVRVGTVLVDGATDPVPVTPFVLEPEPGGFRLTGRAALVVDVPDADRLLVLARGPGGAPVVVEVAVGRDGIEVAAQPLVDATRSVGSVTADGALVSAGSVLPFAGDPAASVRRLLDRAAVAVAIDSLGISKAMLDATVAYAGIRTQFGRPIGSFQAVKHACADMLVRISVSEELVRTAIADLVDGGAKATVSASMAKAYVGEAAVEVAGKAMQLHGGFGYAWESGIHSYLKRAALDRTLLGSPVHHRRLLAARLVRRALPDPV